MRLAMIILRFFLKCLVLYPTLLVSLLGVAVAWCGFGLAFMGLFALLIDHGSGFESEVISQLCAASLVLACMSGLIAALTFALLSRRFFN